MEKWREIAGYEGYLVSDEGRIALILNTEDGRVRLTKDGERKSVSVARLLKETFNIVPLVKRKERPVGNSIKEWDSYMAYQLGEYYVQYARECVPERRLRLKLWKEIDKVRSE